VAIVELVVAELVEASKRPQEKANEDGGFDRLSHRGINIDFRELGNMGTLHNFFCMIL